MSLSSGTLNLKFMQRAAARNAAKPASKPADKGTGTGTPSTPAAGTPTATPKLPSTPGAATPDSAASPAPDADDAARWFLPRRGVPSTPTTATAGPSRPRVQFVASYLPFVEDGGADVGRRSFGGFGTNEDGEEGDGDEEDEEEDGNESMDDVDVPQLRKGKEREDAPREFLRPAGFSPPRTNTKNTAKSKSKQPGSAVSTPSHSSRPSPAPPSHADKLRDTISGLKTVSVSKKRGAEGDGGAAKRAKLDGASVSRDSTPGRSADKSGGGGGKNSKPSGKGGKIDGTTGNKSKNKGADTGGALKGKKDKPSALDERERQLKAAKKAKKRAAAA